MPILKALLRRETENNTEEQKEESSKKLRFRELVQKVIEGEGRDRKYGHQGDSNLPKPEEDVFALAADALKSANSQIVYKDPSGQKDKKTTQRTEHQTALGDQAPTEDVYKEAIAALSEAAQVASIGHGDPKYTTNRDYPRQGEKWAKRNGPKV